MVLFVSSDAPHCKGNESQDTVSLLKTMMMLTEKETQLQEAKGFMKSIRGGEELRRYIDKIKMYEDSRLPLVGGICEV